VVSSVPLTSCSSSGKAYTTPAGHTPKWVGDVRWHRASAFEPSTYAELVGSSSAVVHTLGILLEDTGYKSAVRRNDVFGLAKAVIGGLSGGDGNPLKSKEQTRRGYEGMNRDSGEGSYMALRIPTDKLPLGEWHPLMLRQR
jgi:hypothetical protein